MKLKRTTKIGGIGLLILIIVNFLIIWNVTNHYFLSNEEKQLIKETFSFPLDTKGTKGFLVGNKLAIHIIKGDIYEFSKVSFEGEEDVFGKCIPIVARYEVSQDYKNLIANLLNEKEKTDQRIVFESYPELWMYTTQIFQSTLNGLLLNFYGNLSIQRKILERYVGFPELRSEETWLNGRIYFFPSESDEMTKNEFYGSSFVKNEKIYKIAFLGFKFPTESTFIQIESLNQSIEIKTIKNLSKRQYLKIAKDAFYRGIKSVIDTSETEKDQKVNSILLPALNAPAFPFEWVGEAQANAIRNIASELIDPNMQFDIRPKYKPLVNSPNLTHIFIVIWRLDEEKDHEEFIQGLKEGFSNPFINIFYLVILVMVSIILYMIVFYLTPKLLDTKNLKHFGMIAVIIGIIGGLSSMWPLAIRVIVITISIGIIFSYSRNY